MRRRRWEGWQSEDFWVDCLICCVAEHEEKRPDEAADALRGALLLACSFVVQY